MDYSKYLEKWIDGIGSEARFWENLFASQGKIGGDPEVFQFRINPDCPFQIPEDIELQDNKILDVGSGPYSRLGFKMSGKKIDLTLIDPLASIYKSLEKRYRYCFPVSAQTGMVECLNLILEENCYDIVHMSNSLDHCFDPIEGVKQLLFVTKVGGKVILRHSNNEAENANYAGFHQWNLTVKDNHFIIWGKEGIPIVVDDIVKEYATVEYAQPYEEKIFNDTWRFNKVVIRKNASFNLESIYAGNILVRLIEAINSHKLSQNDYEKLGIGKRMMHFICNRR